MTVKTATALQASISLPRMSALTSAARSSGLLSRSIVKVARGGNASFRLIQLPDINSRTPSANNSIEMTRLSLRRCSILSRNDENPRTHQGSAAMEIFLVPGIAKKNSTADERRKSPSARRPVAPHSNANAFNARRFSVVLQVRNRHRPLPCRSQ